MKKTRIMYHVSCIKGFCRFLFFSVFLSTFNFQLSTVHAICPVCTAAALGGVGLSRWLGIDDLASGVWIGGALASTVGWAINYLNNKKIIFWGRNVLLAIISYAMVVVPFYYSDIVTHPKNKYVGSLYLGVDKLLLGIAIGTIVFILSVMAYELAKRRNGGHAHFPFEKIVFPIGSLLAVSLVLFYITK